MRRLSGILLVYLAGTLAGCVQRELVITSDPPGADVVVNQQFHGKTPYHLPFKHYGVYDIRLTHPGYTHKRDNKEEVVRFYPLQVAEPVVAPGYQKMGADFVSEALVPTTIHDIRELHYTLEKIETADNMKDILERADALRAENEAQIRLRAAKDESRKPIHLPLREKRPSATATAQPEADVVVAQDVTIYDPVVSYPAGTILDADGRVISLPTAVDYYSSPDGYSSAVDVPDATPPSPDRLPIF